MQVRWLSPWTEAGVDGLHGHGPCSQVLLRLARQAEEHWGKGLPGLGLGAFFEKKIGFMVLRGIRATLLFIGFMGIKRDEGQLECLWTL